MVNLFSCVVHYCLIGSFIDGCVSNEMIINKRLLHLLQTASPYVRNFDTRAYFMNVVYL